MEKRTHAQQVAEADFRAAVAAVFHCKVGDVRRRRELLRQAARAEAAMRRAYRGEEAERRMQMIYANEMCRL